jgi:endonuclease YncB( thermonuclease family)
VIALERRKILVTHVDDGDSFDGHFISENGSRSEQEYTFRLIGVDTPESDQAGYKEASAYTRKTLTGKVIDIDVHAKDVYHRYLITAYIKQGDETINYNKHLESKGYVYHRGHHHRPKWND